jgi:hypothetical protein
VAYGKRPLKGSIARAMRFDALPGSPLPDQLRELGYLVERTGETERILPHTMRVATVLQFELRVP